MNQINDELRGIQIGDIMEKSGSLYRVSEFLITFKNIDTGADIQISAGGSSVKDYAHYKKQEPSND